MNNKFVIWILVILVVVIWGNMIRVSLPVIMEFFSTNKVEQEYSSALEVDPYVKVREVDYSTIEPFRNPFDRSIKLVKPVKNVNVASKESREVYSFFNFKGSFSVNGKKVAILEGRGDLGISGVFYVSEGDTVMNEKVVEIGENYVIILKDGVRLTLYEVR